MAEYIECEAVKKSIIECFGDLSDKDAEYIIENIPDADVVEVVRCKDCKRYIKGHAGEQSNYCDCHTTTFEKFFCMPNDYCSNGERKCENG